MMPIRMSFQSQFSVEVIRHRYGHIVNPGFQNSHRAHSYSVTQPYIVPKAQVFLFVCELINRHFTNVRPSIKILDPGIGPAPFEAFLLSHGEFDKPSEISVCGIDLSYDMIRLGQHTLASTTPSQSIKSAYIEMHSGVNCLRFDEALKLLRLEDSFFSLVLHSQFEHYFPNAKDSRLGLELSRAGLAFITKKHLRKLAYQLLEPGGIYVTFDDFKANNPSTNAINDLCWDISVLRRFCCPAVQRRIGKAIPELEKAMQKRYNPRFGISRLLQSIANTRSYRRRLCREEIQRLDVAKRDLEELFGRENVFIRPHPRRCTHASFHLLYAIKR